MLWTLDADLYPGEIMELVTSTISDGVPFHAIREMAATNPGERASAAQMLAKLYQGEGLKPERNVPVLATGLDEYQAERFSFFS
jgi:hypothetical protein